MTKEERIYRLKQIEKDLDVCSLDATFSQLSKLCAIRSAIDELEERKTGKWVFDKYLGLICSECKEIAPCRERNYCPRCGAKMEGSEEA